MKCSECEKSFPKDKLHDLSGNGNYLLCPRCLGIYYKYADTMEEKDRDSELTIKRYLHIPVWNNPQ